MKYPADKKWCCVRGGPFRKAKGPFKRCCPDPVSWSMWRTYRYHLGTVAFGSFIIAVVQFMRIILAYIDQRTKKLQKKSKLVRFLMKFVQVLMWIFEKTMKYVSRSAYIMCAMTGDSFCTSTKNAVLLFIEFLKELSVTKAIATIMIILGKVLVVAISATLGFLWLKFDPDFQKNGARELSSTHLPTLIIVTLSFAVAEGFMHVYGLSSTQFSCAIARMSKSTRARTLCRIACPSNCSALPVTGMRRALVLLRRRKMMSMRRLASRRRNRRPQRELPRRRS